MLRGMLPENASKHSAISTLQVWFNIHLGTKFYHTDGLPDVQHHLTNYTLLYNDKGNLFAAPKLSPEATK